MQILLLSLVSRYKKYIPKALKRLTALVTPL